MQQKYFANFWKDHTNGISSDQTNNIFSSGCAGTSDLSGKKTSKAKTLNPHIAEKPYSHHCDNTKPQAQTNTFFFWDNYSTEGQIVKG